MWAPNGGELFYLNLDRTLMAVPVTTGASFRSGAPTELPISGYSAPNPGRVYDVSYDVSSDDLRFLMLKSVERDPTSFTEGEFRWVVNWFEELNRMVPPGR